MKLLQFLFLTTAVATVSGVQAQSDGGWTLKRCIDYAKQNNIQIQNQRITSQIAQTELEAVKASRYPTLSFSTNHSMSIQNKTMSYNEFNESTDSKVSYSGNYGLSAGATLWAGGKLQNNVKRQQSQVAASESDVNQSMIDIEIAVIQAYVSILNAQEQLKVAELAVTLSQAQAERATQLCDAGSISKVELAQFNAQAANDRYQVVLNQSQVRTTILTLKQLLELDLNTDFGIAEITIDDSRIMAHVPALSALYQTALQTIPNIRSQQLSVEAAKYSEKISKASFYPTLSANAGASTGTYSGTGIGYIDQLSNKLNESAGVSLSIPIFNGKQARTSYKKAQLQRESAELNVWSAEKQLLSTVESLHNNALSYQSQYLSLQESLKASQQSYQATDEQFKAGLKNTIELITEKNNYMTAYAQTIQAKYNALMTLQILAIYNATPVEL